MESFFHTLKTEFVMHYDYKTRDDARVSLFDYMEVFYNRQRRHSSFATRPRYRSRRPQNASLPCPPNVGRINGGHYRAMEPNIIAALKRTFQGCVKLTLLLEESRSGTGRDARMSLHIFGAVTRRFRRLINS